MRPFLAILFLSATAALLPACKSDPKTTPPDAPQPKVWTLNVLRMLPHDTDDFTQGLEVYNGYLYEGTGQYGRSRLKRKNLKTGRNINSVGLDRKYFGEGITIFNDTIYQLTWKEEILHQYDPKTLRQTGLISYEGEGWGLTNDGKEIIMSNGSDIITFRDPKTFAITRELPVTLAGKPLKKINELEFVDGRILANIWQTEMIVAIDPISGHVVARIDCTTLLKEARKHHKNLDVLNGIALLPNGNLLVTGKRWPTFFEVELIKGTNKK